MRDDGPTLIDRGILSGLERDVGGEIVARGIDLFLEQVPERLAAVRAGAREADLDAAAEALHSIKSSAAMLGAVALSEAAERAERVARNRRETEFTDAIEGFEQALHATTEILRKRRKDLQRQS